MEEEQVEAVSVIRRLYLKKRDKIKQKKEINSIFNKINFNFSSTQLLNVMNINYKPVQNEKNDEEKSNVLKKDIIISKEEVMEKYTKPIFKLWNELEKTIVIENKFE